MLLHHLLHLLEVEVWDLTAAVEDQGVLLLPEVALFKVL